MGELSWNIVALNHVNCWLLVFLRIHFKLSYVKEQTGNWDGENYPFCTDNSYSLQNRKLLFCRQIVHKSKLRILLGFSFFIINAKMPAIEFIHLCIVLHKGYPFCTDNSTYSFQGCVYQHRMNICHSVNLNLIDR